MPQKVKLAPSCVTESEGDLGQSKQAASEGRHRARRSAAMIGLALSMGAQSLLLPHRSDEAMAAEPIASEPTPPAPTAFDVATVSAPAEAVAPNSMPSSNNSTNNSTVEHTVEAGQTLRQIARLYDVDVISIADANHLSVNAVLKAGQVLKVPVRTQVARSIRTESDATVSIAPEYYGPIAGTSAQPQASADTQLRVQQETALARLQQKRDSLRTSLSRLKANAPQAVAELSSKPQRDEALVVATEAAQAPQPTSPVAAAAAVREQQVQPESPAVQAKAVNKLAESPKATEQQVSVVAKEQQVVATAPTYRRDVQPSAVPELPTTAKQQADVVTSAGVMSYRVASGDTLSAIARAHGVSQQQLAKVNRILNPNLIQANQTLLIPRSNGVGGAELTATTPVLSASVAPIGALPRITSGNPTARMHTQAADDVQVATVPFAGNTKVDEAVNPQRYTYVENLKQEIVKLRERYRTAGLTPIATTSRETPKLASAQLTVSGPQRLNPELTAASRATTAEALKPASAPRGRTPQLVATAPIGSQNYAPLDPASLGQMVSPDLPPLGSGDTYLPRGSGKFAGYIWPAKGMLTSGFGWRWGRMHKGIDIAAPIGTPVVAAATGTVTYAGWNSGGYGNLVEITHPDGSVTLYAHNNRILVREGQSVEQGQQIAEMGSTGYSTGPHSHFEVHLPGQGAVNPMAYLPRGGA